ncbi:hypothetical protein GCM10029992_62640 [Glycomyces albus]
MVLGFERGGEIVDGVPVGVHPVGELVEGSGEFGGAEDQQAADDLGPGGAALGGGGDDDVAFAEFDLFPAGVVLERVPVSDGGAWVTLFLLA